MSLVLAAVLVVTGSAAARRSSPRPVAGERAALAAVTRAVAAGRLTPAAAKTDRTAIARAAHLVRVLPASRGKRVEVALEQVGALGRRLTSPRALVLTGQLQANDDYFARRGAPGRTDIKDADGIVYRYFAGSLLRVPSARRVRRAQRARVGEGRAGAETPGAGARCARRAHLRRPGVGVLLRIRRRPCRRGSRGWRRRSRRRRSPAPRRSCRTRRRVSAMRRRARTRDPGEARHEHGGRARGSASTRSTRLAVLNAQLQTIYSLEDVRGEGSRLARRRARHADVGAAAAMLPRFDTGYWTYYSLPPGVDSALPELRRAPPQPARAERRAVRGRGEALRRLRAAAARVHAPAGRARRASLLALEAGDGDRDLARRPDEARRPQRRLALARLGRAEARRHLPGQGERRRLGGQPLVVRRAAAGSRPQAREQVGRRPKPWARAAGRPARRRSPWASGSTTPARVPLRARWDWISSA